MLKELKISHLILIEQAHIDFETGFTVLSGETGAGKSAIIEALKLVLGSRTDPCLLRHGAVKGSVVAVFDISLLPRAVSFLKEKGIEPEDPSLLILGREITSNGKTVATINHQRVQLNLLRELSEFILGLVGQHDNHDLFHLDQHRLKLDLFGDYSDIKQSYEEAWQELQTQQLELQGLKNSLLGSVREIEICEREIKEIEEAHVKENEEETLFNTYSLLSSTAERQSSVHELTHSFTLAYSALTRSKSAYASLQTSDPKFAEELSLYPGLLLETEELLHSLRKYESKLDLDPAKLESINQRLTLLSRLKRKYGDTNLHLASQKERLKTLQNLEAEVEWKTHAYEDKLKEVQQLAAQISFERKKSASLFAQKMTESLHDLNMKQAEFHIEISSIPLHASGQDKVEFFLNTNVGEKRIALKESASGGEMARVLLSLHVLLAGKEKVGTLVFDEIDANIGGTTAAIMGEKLKLLGESLQIISITHFPQVAKCADHHLEIFKTTQNGRTISQINYLVNRSKELARMAGCVT